MNKKNLVMFLCLGFISMILNTSSVLAEGYCTRNIDSSKWMLDYSEEEFDPNKVQDIETSGVSKKVCCQIGGGQAKKYYCDYYKPVTQTKYENGIIITEPVEPDKTPEPTPKPSIEAGEKIPANCGIISDLIPYIREIYGFMKIALPIALIIFGAMDFTTPILSNDKEALSKATTKFMKRCIIVIAIFFVPTILKYLLNAYSEATGNNVSLCGLIDMILWNWR